MSKLLAENIRPYAISHHSFFVIIDMKGKDDILYSLDYDRVAKILQEKHIEVETKFFSQSVCECEDKTGMCPDREDINIKVLALDQDFFFR